MRRCLTKWLFFLMGIFLIFGITACDNAEHEAISVISIEKTSTQENIDTYTILYSDNTKSHFTITNGINGEQGIQGVKGNDGHTPIITIGENGNWYIDGVDSKQKAQGLKGEKGDKGDEGRSVVSIKKTSTKENIDTYTILYSDNTKSYFTITNGINGEQGIQGVKGTDGHTPIITIGENGNWYIDGVDSKQKAQGDKGVDGLSAYELYIKNNPDYKKSEQDWLQDLADGRLHTIEINLNGNGGEISQSKITAPFGSYVSIEKPERRGYDFVAWSLNGSIIDINTYVFFADCTLKAEWKEAEKLEIRFDADGGVIVPARMEIDYGEEYALPMPSKEYQTFVGWYYLDTLIPQTGVWEYTHEDITLTAKWDKTNIYANLSVDEESGTIDTTRVTLSIGDYFTLPIPTSIKVGESFQGWYYGEEKVTDSQGNSFEKCTWVSTVTLTAAYYTEISTIYEFMDLAGKDLVGKYIITQDLDFKGLAVNSINSLSGIFDGGGHTLKNFILSTTANSTTYSGLFHEISESAIIENLRFENCSTKNKYSSLLVGKVNIDLLYNQLLSIKNIQFFDSFNNIDARSILIGSIVSLGNSATVVEIDNISYYDSGNQVYTFGIYSICGHVDSYTSTYKTYYDISYPGANFYNIHIEGEDNINQDACALIYGVKEEDADTTGMIFDKEYQGELIIKNYCLNQNIAFGVAKNGSQYDALCQVEKATILAKTKVAFSGVKQLSDGINIGLSEKWGAVQSIRCIDAGENAGIYDYSADFGEEQIYSSIVLYPNANNEYFYYTSSGEKQTCVDSTLITKDFFISLLGFGETVWDLDNIDIENGVYPTIKGGIT